MTRYVVETENECKYEELALLKMRMTDVRDSRMQCVTLPAWPVCA
jgi:hypothetical protein